MEVFLEPVMPSLGQKENIDIRFLKLLRQKTTFHNLQKVLKNIVPNIAIPNTMNLLLILPNISDMSTIRIFIYTPDKYTLQNRTVSFLDHEK